MLSRRSLLQHAAGYGLLASWPAISYSQSATWPQKPLRIIVPFTPGGTTDVVTRMVALQLGQSLRQSVIVENKPGAGTVIGVDFVAKSRADGYTLCTVANSFAANKTLVRNSPYDADQDLRPVALMGISEHVLAVHPGSGIKTLDDLRKAALAKPASLSYASFGNGTSAHLSGALLCEQMGAEMIHVPYKGQGPAMADLMGGQVTAMFGNWSEFRGEIQAGKLVALGMATLQRSRFAPQVPTLAEQGVRLESNSWQGMLAPAKTPQDIVARLNSAVNAALASERVTRTFEQNGIVSRAGTPQEFAAFIASEQVKYEKIIRTANITLG